MDLLYPEASLRDDARRRVIIECHLGVGDITVLTGAVRDLHQAWPGAFQIDVRTSHPELWFYNPHLASIADRDPGVERVHCRLAHLSRRQGQVPTRYLDLFLRELTDQLARPIPATRAGGEIHLSVDERRTPGPVNQLLGARIPYWIIGAGGKYDITTKWWATSRYQQVVDQFRDRILFVQVGLAEHHHPPLRGVLDLRGRTSLRELVRLMYRAEGVLCGITSLMHLAAAVPVWRTGAEDRPCVVIAGGREPSLLTQYPGHQFIHNVGMLPCSEGGCWKSRTREMHDGSVLDLPEHRCTNVAGDLPRCMDLITAPDVARRIEGYFEGGVTEYLQGYQVDVARRVDRSRAPVPGADLAGRLPPVPTELQSSAGLLLLTGANERMAAVAAITGARAEEYAARHGYRCQCVTFPPSTSRSPYWAKIAAVSAGLQQPDVEWVMWLDADAMIVNQEIAAASLLRSDADLLLASDHNGICCGIFLVRVCEWSRRFFETLEFLGPAGYRQDWLGDLQEQTTLRYLLKTFPSHAAHAHMLEQPVLNSYLETYQPGDFILHLGGLDNAVRLALLQDLQRGVVPATPFADVFLDGR